MRSSTPKLGRRLNAPSTLWFRSIHGKHTANAASAKHATLRNASRRSPARFQIHHSTGGASVSGAGLRNTSAPYASPVLTELGTVARERTSTNTNAVSANATRVVSQTSCTELAIASGYTANSQRARRPARGAANSRPSRTSSTHVAADAIDCKTHRASAVAKPWPPHSLKSTAISAGNGGVSHELGPLPLAHGSP